MTITIGDSQVVTLVADTFTPPELTGFAGIRIIWPAGLQQPTLGVPDTLVIQGQSLPGYLRVNNETSQLEWVMAAAVDPIVQALNQIPGTQGWTSDAAKSVYQNIGGSLLGAGVTLSDARTALTQLYSAAVTDYVAAHPAA